MRYTRTLSLFSKDTLQACIQGTINFLNAHLPTTLTGDHYPGVPRLIGNPLFGTALELTATDGLGLTQVLEKLAALAQEDERGMAYCNMVSVPTLLLTRPEEIIQILLFNSDKVSRGKMIPVFGHLFGHETILTIETNLEWKKKRKELLRWVFNENSLKEAAYPIQKIIDEYVELLKANHTVPSLEQFIVSLTMDVIARTTLGAKPLGDHAVPISKAFDEAMDLVSNPLNEVRERVAMSKLGALAEYFHLKIDDNIEKQKADLQHILVEHFLTPNIDEQGKCSFRENKNIFQQYFESTPDNLEAFETVVEDLGLFLLAGHETTANLLQFCLAVLFIYPKVLQNVRDEIEAHRPKDNEWTRDDLQQMTYLGKFLKEVLRLYPPFPIFPREVTEDIILADIPYCRTKQEYAEAFANRDKSKDKIILKGSAIIISPLITHRLSALFPDPLEFRPERYKSGVESFGLKLGISGKDKDLSEFLIPFGLGDRECLGKLFALQEAMLAIIKIVDQFDFQATLVNKEGGKTKLLNTYIRNTLKQYGEVSFTFTEREKKKAELSPR